ncbi:MAG: response regulator [Campylobacterota bacterium]|nr:response regulator [Campylobacterota bacterium]
MHKKVLVVDDIDFIIEFEKRIIESLAKEHSIKIDIDSANTVKEALLKISQNSYHAIIIDMNLPDGSGVTIAQSAQEKSKDTYIAALTISSDTYKANSQYFDAFLIKPISPNTYKETLSKLLYL